MTVRLAKNSGFCPGVKRAIRIALDAVGNHRSLVTLGPIIHNAQMVEYLKKLGVVSIDRVDDIEPGQTVIIRSHGVTVETYELLKARGAIVIDATCPYVAKTHQYACELRDQGYRVTILGDAEHPEVIGMVSYIQGEADILTDPEDFTETPRRRIGILSQTTQPVEKLQALVSRVIPWCDDLRVMNTICAATSIRQTSTMELAQDSDVMIVVGGRNSSNTKMLARISEKWVETHQIEAAEEIVFDWLENKEKVGITAGASTPDWIILEVYNKIIEEYVGRDSKAVNVEDIPGYKEE
jgi:4-hydroxy-3-methylbut-2-en-1-yl diphosphate reductase